MCNSGPFRLLLLPRVLLLLRIILLLLLSLLLLLLLLSSLEHDVEKKQKAKPIYSKIFLWIIHIVFIFYNA